MRVDTTQFATGEAEKRPFLASMGIYVFDYPKLLELLKADSTCGFGQEVTAAIKARSGTSVR